jgi:hypothetical protein
VIIGGGAVAILGGDDHESRQVFVHVDGPGFGPYGPGWRRWQMPDGGDKGGRGDYPPGFPRQRIVPFPQPKMPQEPPPDAPQPVPSASPSA